MVKSRFVSYFLTGIVRSGLLIVGIALSPLPLSTVEASPVSNCNSVTISGHPDFPPLIWAETDRMEGVGSQVAIDLLESLGIDVKHLADLPYKRVQAYFEMGKVDVIGIMARNEKREAYTRFLEPPISYAQAVLWVRKNTFTTYKSLEDLHGYKGVLRLGSSYGTSYDSFFETHDWIVKIKDVEAGFEMITQNRADFFVYDELRARMALDRLDLTEKVSPIDTPFGRNPLYLAMSLKSKCIDIADQLEERLSKWMSEENLDELISAKIMEYNRRAQ